MAWLVSASLVVGLYPHPNPLLWGEERGGEERTHAGVSESRSVGSASFAEMYVGFGIPSQLNFIPVGGG